MKQLTLFNNDQLKFHGGRINTGKRKTTRPLSTKQAIHLVLKCNREVSPENKNFSLFCEFETIKFYINKYAFKFKVRVYSLSVQHDHIHILLKIDDRNSYKKFSRALTGVLARKYGRGLWKLSPFTRIIGWGRDYKTVKEYLSKNEDEIWGVKNYTPRNHNYGKYL